VEDAVARGALDAKAVTRSLLRIQGLRRRRATPRATRLGWPAHARLAARIAADVSSPAARHAR
jgi:hypothetical protein